MSFIAVILKDLRERRLWPLALLLLVALVAVPVMLSHSSSAAPASHATSVAAVPGGSAVPIVSVQNVPSRAHLRGHGRDPFAQPRAATTTTAATAPGPSTTTASTTPTPTRSGSGGSAATTTTSTTASGTTTSSATPTPTSKPKPTPGVLTALDSYAVTVAVTNPSGDLNTIDPLVRLAGLPSAQQPLLLELGVLRGADRVLFAVLPGTVAHGAGRCVPGPVDCELISLAPNRIEKLWAPTPSGPAAAASFAVTAISAVHHPTVAAARHAREGVSVGGQRLLAVNRGKLPALSLFAYRPLSGAVVDLRNLTVGGTK